MSDLQAQLESIRVDFENWHSINLQAADEEAAWLVWQDCADHYANRIAELERQLADSQRVNAELRELLSQAMQHVPLDKAKALQKMIA